MDLSYKIYLQRAQNELNLARIILILSEDKNIQLNIFNMKEDTYYSAVISHAYYSIFYMAKSYLLFKNIKTSAPEEHKKTFNEFSNFVDSGQLDVELLNIYRSLIIKADSLLNILNKEKLKRGKFTYHKLSQANNDPAKESVNNAKKFFKNINLILSNRD